MKAIINVQGILHNIKNPVPVGDSNIMVELVVRIDESYTYQGTINVKFNFLQMAAFGGLAREIGNIRIGQTVDVSAKVTGKEYEKNGEQKYFTNIHIINLRVLNPTIEQDAYRRANEPVTQPNPQDRIPAQYADAYAGSTIITGETDLPF